MGIVFDQAIMLGRHRGRGVLDVLFSRRIFPRFMVFLHQVWLVCQLFHCQIYLCGLWFLLWSCCRWTMEVLVTTIICVIRSLFKWLYYENRCGSIINNTYIAICEDECVCGFFCVCGLLWVVIHIALRMFGYLGSLVDVYTCSGPLKIGCLQCF